MIKRHHPQTTELIKAILGDKLISLTPVGSRETCDPPPESGDFDYLALVFRDWEGPLLDAGFKADGADEYEGEDFISYRRDDVNIIASTSIGFVEKFICASTLVKRLNLLDREDRVAVFQAVFDRKKAHPRTGGQPHAKTYYGEDAPF